MTTSVDELSENVLVWKYEQKNIVANMVQSILLKKGLLTDTIRNILDVFINEELDEKYL